MLYELINPSDQYYFEAKDLEIAALCVAVIGEGKYGATPVEEGATEVPLFLLGADKWFKQQFKVSFEESFDRVLKNEARKNELADAFESMIIGSLSDRELYFDTINNIEDTKKKEAFHKKWVKTKTSSLNGIGEYARELGKKTRLIKK
jgi:hypothetical protein